MKTLFAILPLLVAVNSPLPLAAQPVASPIRESASCLAAVPTVAQSLPGQPQLPIAKPIRTQPTFDLKVRGGTAKLVPPQKAGLPLQALPGVKRISFQQWAELKTVPPSGLYLVDTSFVPMNLAQQLQKERLTLKPDGRLLDEKGEPITLFVKTEVFEVNRSSSQPSLSQGLTKALHADKATLQAANPYPFSWFSWSMWWRYRGGFCRDYRAWTTAEAWGPEQGGARPHTRIEYIETRAQIGGRLDRDNCSNCDNESSYVRWDIGCFWPAHGGASGWHYANWKDGDFSATRTWSWLH